MQLLIFKNHKLFIFINIIISELFKISLITLIFFYIIDMLGNNIISDYFNLNILLITTITSGIVTQVFKDKKTEAASQNLKKWDYLTIIIFGIVSSLLIYSKINEIGKLSYLIAGLSGIMIILISALMLKSSFDDLENND